MGEMTGQSVLSNRLIWHHYKNATKLLLRRDRRTIANLDVWTNTEITPELVEDCLECDFPPGFKIYRVKLDSPLTLDDGLVYRYLTSLDGETRFNIVSRFQFFKKTRLRGNMQKYAFFEGGYLYLSEWVPCLRISYLSEANGDSCSKLDREALRLDHLQLAAEDLTVERLTMFISRPKDTTMNETPNA